MTNKTKYNKSFQSINLSLEELLKKAIEYKKSILN